MLPRSATMQTCEQVSLRYHVDLRSGIASLPCRPVIRYRSATMQTCHQVSLRHRNLKSVGRQTSCIFELEKLTILSCFSPWWGTPPPTGVEIAVVNHPASHLSWVSEALVAMFGLLAPCCPFWTKICQFGWFKAHFGDSYRRLSRKSMEIQLISGIS